MKSPKTTDTIGHYPIVSLLHKFFRTNSFVYRDLGSVLFKRIRNMFPSFLARRFAKSSARVPG